MRTNDKRTNIPGNNFKKSTPDKGVIRGMQSWQQNVNLDDPGFDASGSCFYKHGTPYGEAAMFNQLPPGPDISDQKYALINEMPFKSITDLGYPGDGGFEFKDVSE